MPVRERHGIRLRASVHNEATETHVFVFSLRSPPTLAVAFRGTACMAHWRQNCDCFHLTRTTEKFEGAFAALAAAERAERAAGGLQYLQRVASAYDDETRRWSGTY